MKLLSSSAAVSARSYANARAIRTKASARVAAVSKLRLSFAVIRPRWMALPRSLAVPCGLLAGSQTGYTIGLRCAKRTVEDNDSLGTLDRVVRHNFAVDALPADPAQHPCAAKRQPVTVDVREIRDRRLGRCGQVSQSRGFGGSGGVVGVVGSVVVERRSAPLQTGSGSSIRYCGMYLDAPARSGSESPPITSLLSEKLVSTSMRKVVVPQWKVSHCALVSVVLAVRKVCLYLVVGLGRLGLAGVGRVDLNGFCAVLGGCLGRGKICTVELPLLVQKVGHTAQTAVAQTERPSKRQCCR